MNIEDFDNSHIYGVVIAGGRGERFWPKSRKSLPKQLLKIISGKTMLEKTVERINPVIKKDNIFIIANEDIREKLLDLNLGLPTHNYIFEPVGRNTAPAVCISAVSLKMIDAESIMVVLPADHYLKNDKEFRSKLLTAIEFAKEDYLVTFGIIPSRAETGYGYIEAAQKIGNDVYEVKKFKEKPSPKKANEFIKKGNYFWNSGIFVWKTKRIIEEFHNFQDDLISAMEDYSLIKDESKRKRRLDEIYSKLEAISIDYAIMEKASNVAVVKSDFGWDDVGSWNSLERLKKKDKHGNVVDGDVVYIDANNSILVAEHGVIAVVGFSNIIVVHTRDATLVLPKEKAQEVKEIVQMLKSTSDFKKYT